MTGIIAGKRYPSLLGIFPGSGWIKFGMGARWHAARSSSSGWVLNISRYGMSSDIGEMARRMIDNRATPKWHHRHLSLHSPEGILDDNGAGLTVLIVAKQSRYQVSIAKCVVHPYRLVYDEAIAMARI